jgi:hypothetical protein
MGRIWPSSTGILSQRQMKLHSVAIRACVHSIHSISAIPSHCNQLNTSLCSASHELSTGASHSPITAIICLCSEATCIPPPNEATAFEHARKLEEKQSAPCYPCSCRIRSRAISRTCITRTATSFLPRLQLGKQGRLICLCNLLLVEGW